MKRSWLKSLFFVMLSFSMLAGGVTVNAQQLTVKSNGSNKVQLNNGSYIELVDASIMPTQNGSSASFVINFYNGGTKDLSLIDYWARLETVSGSKLKLHLADTTKKYVSSKSSVLMTYYSEIDQIVTIDQLKLKIIEFDLYTSGYERTLATFQFDKTYSNVVKINGFKKININAIMANIRMDEIKVTKRDKQYSISMKYAIRNTSRVAAQLPQYNYYLSTEVGLFTLLPKESKDNGLLLQPTVLNTVELIGTIPSTVSTKNWRLIITNSVTSNSQTTELPVVSMEAPYNETVTETPVNESNKKSITTDKGEYLIEFKSVDRLPWALKDQIIADLSLTNNSKVYLPMLSSEAEFILDENISLKANKLVNKDELGLAPGASITLQFVGEIPSSYKWNKLSLKINSQDENEEMITTVLTNSDIKPIQQVKIDETYEQKVLGSELTAMITGTRIYESEESEIFGVYLDVTNKFNRSTKLPTLVGYFKTIDGSYYEAQIVGGNQMIKPNNKQQLFLYTELPEEAKKEGIQLLIGEAFNDAGVIKGEGTATGYLRPVQFQLPEVPKASATFKDLRSGAYHVNMTYLNAFMNDLILDIDIRTTVTKDRSYDDFRSNQLLLVLEDDATNQTILSHTVDLEKASDGKMLWKLGDTYSEIREDTTGTAIYDYYTLKVYELFDGKKSLLASKKISWSPYINWMDDNK